MPKKTKRRKRGGASVPCPQCGGSTEVVITRRSDRVVTRKRKCKRCRHKFETREAAS
jgi:hypothetical protein